MSTIRLKAFIEACTGEPATPEQVERVARNLYALVSAPRPDATVEQMAGAGILLARTYLRAAVKSGAESIAAAEQEAATVEAIRLAGEAAVEDV